METRTIPLDEKGRREFENRWNQSEALKHFGLKISLGEDDVIRGIIDPIMPNHRGGMGTEAVNGVVLAGLFDITIGVVGVMQNLGKKTGTLQLSMNFMRPLTGQKVVCEARLVKAGSHLVFAEAKILDDRGRACAMAQGTCALIDSQTHRL